MGYYPAFIDLTEKPVVVIGGGPVAQRKVEGLLDAGARVTVVSPGLTPALQALREAARIRHIPREYREGDVAGYRLCMVATDDGAVNSRVAAEARRRRVLVNAADDVPNCDFILPGVVRRGELVLAASTGGASPALARRLREILEQAFPEYWADVTALLGQVRRESRNRGLSFHPEAWQAAMDDEFFRRVERGELSGARERLWNGLVGAAEVAQ